MDPPSLSGHPSPTDTWIIRNQTQAVRPDLSLKEGEAARLALQELDKLKGSDAYRLGLAPDLNSLDQLRSILKNLDKYLFRGVLGESVSFRFNSKLSPDIHGSTSALGVFGNQIIISLNSNLIRHQSRLTLLAALIHQMCHAYLLACCGFGEGGGSSGEEQKHDLKHGLAFSSILHAIQDLLVDGARSPLPDLFYCGSGLSRSSHLPRFGPGRPSLHSYCYVDVNDHEDRAACGAYMRHVVAAAKATESVRKLARDAPMTNSISTTDGSARLPPNSYTGSVTPFPHALSPATLPSNITMPTSGDYQALLNLQTFLTHGDYEPKITSQLLFDVSNSEPNSRTNTAMAGPPRIHLASTDQRIQESNSTNPLRDLRTYMLAQRSNIEPLRRLALIRLYSQRLLKKEINAMFFLEEIYTGASSDPENGGTREAPKGYQPDADLRHFAQSFLCARHPDMSTKAPGTIQLEYEDTIYGRRVVRETDNPPKKAKDNSNLAILKSRAEYKDRLKKLRSKGGCFLEDLDKVVAALGEKDGGIEMPELGSIIGLRGGSGIGDDITSNVLSGQNGNRHHHHQQQHQQHYQQWQQHQQEQAQRLRHRALEEEAAAAAYYTHQHPSSLLRPRRRPPPSSSSLLLPPPPSASMLGLSPMPGSTIDMDMFGAMAHDNINLERLARLGI